MGKGSGLAAGHLDGERGSQPKGEGEREVFALKCLREARLRCAEDQREGRNAKKRHLWRGVQSTNPLVSHAHVEEEVRTRMLQATRSLGKRKASKKKNEAEEEEDEENAEDLVKDWESISSDEGNKKAARGKGTRNKCPKSAPKPKVSAEAKASAKKANAAIVGEARKMLRVMEPVNKDAKKAAKTKYCSKELQEEAAALASLVKECNAAVTKNKEFTSMGKELSVISISLEGAKELAKTVKAKAEATNGLAKVMENIPNESLKNLADLRAKAEAAEDVE